MIRKVIVGLIGLGVLALVAWKLILPGTPPSEAPLGAGTTLDSNEGAPSSPPGDADPAAAEGSHKPKATGTADGLAGTGAASDGGTNADAVAERHRVAIDARIEQLEELSRQKDPASVEAILLEIRSPDKEVREAALDAIMQSGNRDVLPRLADLALQTDDPEEKRAIEEAAEFLKLPTLTEVMGIGKAGGAPPSPAAAPKQGSPDQH